MFECICETDYGGEFCETTVQYQNCTQAPNKTGIYNILNHGSEPFPVYCDQTTDDGGWTMIFKLVGGLNSSFSGGELWNSSDTFSENVTGALDTTSTYQGNYKNRIVQSWQAFSPKEARVALYTNGTEVLSIIFNAKRTTYLDWFSQKNLIQSPWTDLKKATSILPFHIHGHFGVRSFEIGAHYGGCKRDSGWFLLTGPYCAWEKRTGVVPGILFSKKTHNITWNDNQADVGVAEVMIVYIR